MNLIKDLVKALNTDKEYRQSWVANIAMAYIDSERWHIESTGRKHLNRSDKHIIANKAAEHFIWLLCKPTDKQIKTKIRKKVQGG